MAKVVFGSIGVLWGTVGIFMLVFPSIWRSSLTTRLGNTGVRFLLMQGTVLAGILLMIGTSRLQGFGLWVLIGGIAVALAAFLLGCSSATRDNLIRATERLPLWWYRLGGLMMITLALLFGADLILYGS